MLFIRLLPVTATVFWLSCCSGDPAPNHRLTSLPASTTGINFVNQLTEDDTTHILYNEYLYNGGGVGIGDFDRNGLPDIFLGGNMVSSRLYLQRSSWKFEDVTEQVGCITTDWITGINVHDVNGDGWEDIYLTVLNPDGELNAPNKLYLNQGIDKDGHLSFREAAAEFGLANPAYSTHSAWFDLEGDGDLDLYLLNNALEVDRKLLRGADSSGTARSLDVIFRNVGTSPTQPRFEPTKLVRQDGWGLGVVPQDFNLDGYTDLYIANDFISDDLFLLNDGTGNLRSYTKTAFPHTSKNSMGVDAGDLNNDGLPDVVTADMLPDDNLRQKTMFSDIPFALDHRADLRGYTRQYVRNTLQLNAGDGTYSDVAFLAGIAATDWSWTPLIADLDNNGFRDILISNGYPRDITNRDFVDFAQSTAMFGTDEVILANTLRALKDLDGVHQPNYIFGNFGALDFRRTDWLPDAPTYSNGAAYVDLDGDGDVDLVTNNLNEPAGVYRNYSRERQPDSTHYLQIKFAGPAANPDALGAKVYLSYANGQHSYQEQQRQRGYLSTMSATMHFGLGSATTIDTLWVVWPGGHTIRHTHVAADQRLRLSYPTDTTVATPQLPNWTQPGGRQLTPLPLPGPRHRESSYSDFDAHALAVRDRSHDGPALVAPDLDGDGRQELIVGGGAGQPTIVYQRGTDSLTELQRLPETVPGEATVLAVLDYDQDGDQDLYVGNGSQEFEALQEPYRDLLYENVNGTLVLTRGVLPALLQVTAVVAVADLENDGDPDLFIGSRQQLGAYPRAAPSVVLRNEGGRFTVHQEMEAGLVTDAVWLDLDGDRLADLATVGEYAPPRLYRNQGSTLAPGTPLGPSLAGWWYSLTACDLDQDGDTDLLAGNLGTNSFYQASPDRPLTLRVADYDENGRLDPIMMMYIGPESHPVHPRNTLGRQLPGLKKQATTYAEYAGWTEAIMPPVGEQGFILTADEFRSVYLENDGAGNFRVRVLPNAAQTAPIRDALPTRLPDGRPALLAVQNDYAVEVLGGRLDAGNGFALSIKDGDLVVDNTYWSVRGDARSVVALDSLIAVGINNERVRFYAPPSAPTPLTR